MWRVCLENPFKNCQYVFPMQQRKVERIVNYYKKNPHVKRIVIFGSSVTPYCHPGSDVDFYLELDEDVSTRVREYWDFEYDRWTNFTVDSRMNDEIHKTGVEVYNKKQVNERWDK